MKFLKVRRPSDTDCIMYDEDDDWKFEDEEEETQAVQVSSQWKLKYIV